MPQTGMLTVTTPSDREIAMSRVFDAPRRMVFAAYTKPELLQRWLGVQNGWTLDVCEVDLRVGGAYRWTWRHPQQGEMTVQGVYREVAPPDRLVATELFDQPWYPGEAITTVTFDERDGRTEMTITILYDSKEIRDGVLASPMESGIKTSYDRLDEVLVGMVAVAV